MTGMLNEDLGKFVIVTRWILLRIRNVSGRVCREDQNTHFTDNFFPPEDRAIDTVMRKNIVEPATRQMTVWCIHILRLVPEATDTRSEHVKPIALPRQQWLRERFWMLGYTYSPCLVTLM